MDIQIICREFFDYSWYIRGYSKFTIQRYKQHINFYLKSSGINTIHDIKTENLHLHFIYGRTERNWSPRTFIGKYQTFNVFFKWCIDRRYLSENPLGKLEFPKVEKKLPPKLSKMDSLKLLEVVYNYPYDYRFLRYRNHAIFATFIFAGLRKSELLNLKFADVDLDNLTLFVRQGKGSKDRILPISYTLAQTLRKYLEERKRLNKTCAEFFVSLNRNAGFTHSGLKRLVEKMKTVSGIKFSVHKLRHSFATLMLEGGCDIYSLSRMMGHSDIKTTTIYLAASAEHLRQQIGKHPLNASI